MHVLILLLVSSIQPSDTPAFPWQTEVAQGNWSAALVHIEQQLTTDSVTPIVHFWHGRALYETQQLDQAIKAFKKATKAMPKHAESFYWLGAATLDKLKTTSGFQRGMLAGRSMEALRKAVELNPNHIDARTRLGHYYINAPAIVGGSKRKAEEQAKAVMALDQTKGTPLLAGFLKRSGKLADAAKVYKDFLSDHADPGGMQRSLGQLRVELKQYAQATVAFEKAYADDPEDYYACYLIGRTAALSGLGLHKGLASLEEYLTLPQRKGLPGPDGTYWRMGMIHEHLGHRQQAKQFYEKAGLPKFR